MNVTPRLDDAPAVLPGEAAPAAPPPRTAAERTRAETRARLLASGEALFAEHGLHGVTTHDIAAHAGVAAGTFYNHFRDKGALFAEIAAQALRALESRLMVGEHGDRPLRDAVRPQAEALVAFAAERRDLIRILFSREADASAVQADVLAQLAGRIAEGRRHAIERGEMPAGIAPAVLAQAVVGMWARVVAWWAEDPSRADRDTVVETLTRIQLGGTHPPPPSGADPSPDRSSPDR